MTGVAVGRPLTRGGLALFPLLGEDLAGRGYVPGPAAAATGVLEVSELAAASLPELVVANHGPEPMLLIEGETLLGAKQNRTLNVTVIIDAGHRVTLPVSCVEAGRWGTAQRASRSEHHAPAGLRAAKVESVARSVRAGAGEHADQGRVWADVDRYTAAVSASSPTRALEDAHRAHATRDATFSGTAPLAGQRGVVAVVGRRIVALDLFDRQATLASYWGSLVAGYALDAVALADTGRCDVAGVERWLERVWAARQTRVAGRGLGTTLHALDDHVAATGIEWDGRVVHLAAFPTGTAPAQPIRRPRSWFAAGDR